MQVWYNYFILPGIIHQQLNTGVGGEISSEGESDRDWQLIPTERCKRQPYNFKQFVVSPPVPTLQQYNLKTEILPHLPDPLTIPQVPQPFFAMCPSSSVADPPYTSPPNDYNSYFPFEEEVVVDKPVPESQSSTGVLHSVDPDPDPDPDQEVQVDDDPIPYLAELP